MAGKDCTAICLTFFLTEVDDFSKGSSPNEIKNKKQTNKKTAAHWQYSIKQWFLTINGL